jgi:hypothetical protein
MRLGYSPRYAIAKKGHSRHSHDPRVSGSPRCGHSAIIGAGPLQGARTRAVEPSGCRGDSANLCSTVLIWNRNCTTGKELRYTHGRVRDRPPRSRCLCCSMSAEPLRAYSCNSGRTWFSSRLQSESNPNRTRCVFMAGKSLYGHDAGEWWVAWYDPSIDSISRRRGMCTGRYWSCFGQSAAGKPIRS